MTTLTLNQARENLKALKPRYKVDLIVKGKSHQYRVTRHDGTEVIYPGVTGVLGIISKPALVNWAKRESLAIVQAGIMKLLGDKASKRVVITADFVTKLVEEAKKNPDKQKDDAADLGSRAHAYIDIIVKGGPVGNIDNDILRPISAFSKWWKESSIEILLGDTKVASELHGYGGSLDAVGYDVDHQMLVLLDWKTSKRVYAEYALQVAAYAKAFEETFGIAIHRAVIVRFSKEGSFNGGEGFEVVEVRNIETSFQAFLAAKQLQHFMTFDHLITND